MKLFSRLNEEMKEGVTGAYAPYYYRYLGYRQELGASPATLRANGIYSLFTQTKPIILKNELIAGNKRSLFCTEDDMVLSYARSICDRFPQRSFITNKDHFAPDYQHILSVGISGLIAETEKSEASYADDSDKTITLRAMRKTLVGFSKMIENYAIAAEERAGCEGYDTERLKFIADNCQAIVSAPPKTFAQALQLVWLCHVAFLMEERYAMALGRIDRYLYPFYKADIEAGRITDGQVVELLENVFIRLQDDVVNICIGGGDVEGNCMVNGLSRCVLKAVGNCNVPGPNLSLRYTENTPDDFLDECLKTIGTGLGYPAIMNDRINIAALKKYGYSDSDVHDYCMVGCIENFITGKQPPWSDGRFDTPRFFDFVFNRGVSKTSRTLGVDTGCLSDMKTMDDFVAAYERQLEYGAAEYYATFNSANNSINQAWYAEPFLSCFCCDCIGRGLDINCGGSIYPSVHGVAVMGIGTVCDSLAAVEKVIYIDKYATPEELRDALNANFEGCEELHAKLLEAPKYGNNNDFADKYAVWFMNCMSRLFSKYKTRDGGGMYIAAAANVSNIYAGKVIGATPDGRKSGEPLSDAASPTYGRDTRGATATINSLCKPDYTQVACGSVVNQKYSPSMFGDEKRRKLAALIKTYFKKGGQEIQINATSRETLTDAMEHPEKYPTLVVRVSGFSAFYVTLDRDVQLDILNRTQQE